MRLIALLDLLVIQADEGYEFRKILKAFVSGYALWYLSFIWKILT